ncbi:MAG: methyl-accepting chemotaxis protein [Gammaproteobacteria bacterium]|nr:methyl-accepting chemotaxis protein [Gammaproteobacteria bacterium]
MAEKTSDGKFVPVLALLVLLLLGVSAGWIWMLESQKPAAPEETALSRFALAQNVSIEVSEALQGKADSFRNLSALQLSVSQSGAASMNAIRIALPMVLAAESDLQSLQRSGQRVAVLLPAFVDAVYKLEGQLALQRQPTAVAHLGRLRLLGQLMANDLSALARGDGDATDLIQRATNTEMELSQIITGLLIGDPKLVIQQITDVGAQATVNELSAISEQLSLELSDIVDSSQRLEPVFAAAAEAKSSAAAMGSKGSTSTVTAVNGGLASELLPPLTVLGLAAALLLIMLFSYFRGAGRRAVTAELAMQAGRDEEAILRMLDELGNLADGDLTSQLTVTEDITGAIADSINYAVEALRELVTTIKESTIMVDSATKQSEVSARRLDETQAGQLRQIKLASEAITAMNVSIDEVSGDAERSADVARHSVDVAHKGGAAVRRTIEGMNTIRETIQETSKRIKRLGESSQEIGNIVELINDIAEQTNILALNASIQASMAGEAGRGFAVVADEVQRLAERSTNATKQIEVLVRTIQSDTNEAVVSMERSTTDVVGGALLAENAGAALEEIEQVSNQIAMLVQNISNSAREQAVAAQGVKKNMGELTEIGNSTVENASSTTDSIKKLGQLATQLRKSVAGFRLPESFSETAVLERANFEGLQTKDTVTAEPKDADVIDQHSA